MLPLWRKKGLSQWHDDQSPDWLSKAAGEYEQAKTVSDMLFE